MRRRIVADTMHMAQPPTSVTALLPLAPGLLAVTGDERTGKTTLLRRLGEEPSSLWLDLSLPGQDDQTAQQVWDALRPRYPHWDTQLQHDLAGALDVASHAGKQLFMLSTGSRRKVGIVGLLASGATVTCLDQPFAALDAPSARAIRDFLTDMADHPSRTWVVADYVADAALPWRWHIYLDRAGGGVQ
jgi:translation initiation factor RLI1